MIRSLVGDDDPVAPYIRAERISDCIKLVVIQGKVEGFSIEGDEITPELDESNAAAYGALVWHATKLVAAPLTRQAIRTRALSADFGDPRDLIHNVLIEAYRLESGDQIGG